MTPTLHCLVLMVEQWEGSEGVKPGRHVVRCAVLKTTCQNAVRGADGPVAGTTRKEGTVWLAARSFPPLSRADPVALWSPQWDVDRLVPASLLTF